MAQLNFTFEEQWEYFLSQFAGSSEVEKTALWCAVQNNRDLKEIKKLLAAGGDVNCRNVGGNTLLHIVQSADVVRELVSLGLNVNAENYDWETPLITAVRGRRGVEVVESLLAAGADANANICCYENVLFCAVQSNNDLQVIKSLLAAGGNDDGYDWCGNLSLHVVQSADVARELISAGHDINAMNTFEETPLQSAVIRREIELVELFLELGAKVDSMDFEGNTLLFSAVENSSDLKLFNRFLTAGGDVNWRSVNGNTLLHLAGSAEIAGELFSLGLSIDAVNAHGETPLHTAVKKGKGIELIEYLLDACACDVNACTLLGETPLYSAIESNNDLEIIKVLLMAGGDVNCRTYDGNSLLHVVRHADVAKELLFHGLDVNATNKFHETPLYRVAKDALHSFKCGHKNDEFSQISQKGRTLSVCHPCRLKELVWTLVLHGAAIRCEINSPLDIVSEEWIQFLIKTDLMKSYFDSLEGSIDLSLYKSYLNRLKNRDDICDSFHIELFHFFDNSVAEILHMKYDIISSNLTLYNFFFNCEKKKKIFPLYPRSDKIEEEISIKYPIYREHILPKIRASVKRSTLLDKMKALSICVNKSETEEISFDYYTLIKIGEYLSNEDLANLVSVQ